MKRLVFFDWMRRHKAATLVPAMVAAFVVSAWLLRGDGGSAVVLATAVASLRSAETCLERSQLGEAERECARAIEILDSIAMRSRDPQIRFEHAAAFETMALIQSGADRRDEADVFFRKAIPLWAKLLGDNPMESTVRWRLARCLARHASLFSDAGRWEEAEKSLTRGDLVCRTRLANAAADERVDRERVLIKNQLGLVFLRTDRWALALEQFESAASTQQEFIGTSSPVAEDLELLITLRRNQALTYSAADQPAAALRTLGEARALAERLSTLYPSTARYQDLLASFIEHQADASVGDAGKRDQVRELLARAILIREALAARSPDEPLYVEELATSYGKLAEECLSASLFAQAEEYARKEVSCQSKLLSEHPGVVAYRFGRGRALHNLAELLRQRGRGAEALSLARQAAPLLAAVHRENLFDLVHRQAASNACWSLCTLELDQKDHRAAAEAVSVLQAIEPRGFEEAHESAGFLCRCVALCRSDHGSPPMLQKKRASTDPTPIERSPCFRRLSSVDTTT